MNVQEKQDEISRLEKRLESATSNSLKSTLINDMGFLYQELGKYKKALPLYKKTLKTRLDTSGENHPNTAVCYNNLFCTSCPFYLVLNMN